MAARPLHGLHLADQFAEFQRNLRLSIIPTGEAHHDAAEETSAHANYQVSCKSSRASSVVNLGFLTGISSITRPAPVMLMFLSSTPGFSAPNSQSSQSICVSFQAMAAVSPSSSCNSASLSEGSSAGSLDSSDGGRMQSPVSSLWDLALPFDHPSMIDARSFEGIGSCYLRVVRDAFGVLTEPRPQTEFAS
jgi:hypothetical protein